MRELEKILEEIDEVAFHIDSHYIRKELRDQEDLYVSFSDMNGIIRKHINDGWIPSKKHLPEVPKMGDEYPEFNVMIEGAKIPTTLQYSCDGVWIDDYGNVYNVIAWQPLPESYIPKMQDAKNNYEPEWKRNFRKKFERRM